MIEVPPCQTYKFGWDFAIITAAALGAYTWFTIRTTSWRTRFRRDANKADNKAASVAVDSLINYEAVKVASVRVGNKSSLK